MNEQEKDEWVESARRYITTEPECDCDCFLCIRGEHHEGCFEDEGPTGVAAFYSERHA